MLKLVNELRAEAKMPPVKLDDRLNRMAQDHSVHQANIRTMTHDDPDGALGERLAKYSITNWRGVSENVARGSTDVAGAFQQWKNSPGHYNNMAGEMTIAGFGVSNYFWTQNFAKLA
ncbi:hypothetical protein H4R19_002505 [Coemansia spiralis]|nr:hypothetical protein H4R19_002505 [Coemansia spiralis]